MKIYPPILVAAWNTGALALRGDGPRAREENQELAALRLHHRCYAEGNRAHRRGESVRDCPYEVGTEEAWWWREGYLGN